MISSGLFQLGLGHIFSIKPLLQTRVTEFERFKRQQLKDAFELLGSCVFEAWSTIDTKSENNSASAASVLITIFKNSKSLNFKEPQY